MNCLQVEMSPLIDMISDVRAASGGDFWIDYLKIDCEGCEMDALPRFLNDSMARWGHVPVTQLQIEIHVANRLQSYGEERKLVRSYGEAGLLHGKQFSGNFNNPQRIIDDIRARSLLDILRSHAASCRSMSI